jgi:putative transcriptional regulator
MTGDQLRELRKELGFSQVDFARALNVSFATLNRWETGIRGKEVPTETARLLACLREMLQNAKSAKAPISPQELSEAITATGVIGAVATAAAAGMIGRASVALLVATGPFGWLAGVVGVGSAVALPFFQKIRALRERTVESNDSPLAPRRLGRKPRKCKK